MSEESKPNKAAEPSREPIFYDLPKATEAKDVVPVVDMTAALEAAAQPPPLDASAEEEGVHLHPEPDTPPLGRKLSAVAMMLSGVGVLLAVVSLFTHRDLFVLVYLCLYGIAFILGVVSLFTNAGLLRGVLATASPVLAFGLSVIVAVVGAVFFVVKEAPAVAKAAENAKLQGIEEARRVAAAAREKNSVPLPPRPVAGGPPKISEPGSTSLPVIPPPGAPPVIPPAGADPLVSRGSGDQVPLPKFDAGEAPPLESEELLPPEQRKVPVVGGDVLVLWKVLEKGYQPGASQYDQDQADRVARACGYSSAVFSQMSPAQRLYVLKLVVTAIGGVSSTSATSAVSQPN